jgi:glycosyltransferase involved in cell wall biosynthesis
MSTDTAEGFRRGRVRAGQEVAWFHLGHDLDPIAADAPIRPRIAALFADEPVLLNVGWLDPRKNQLRLFDALKEVLASGTAAGCCWWASAVSAEGRSSTRWSAIPCCRSMSRS